MNFVTLGSIADIQLGKMLSPNAKTGSSSFPYLRNQNVQWGRIDIADLAQMDFSERERGKFSLRDGDLLICEGGEPGRCAVWQGTLQDCYYQKALHRVRPHDGVADSEFLYLWIRHQADIGAFKDQNAKTTIAHLPLVRLEQLQVPDLCVQDQRRIAQELKTQLAVVEEARRAAQAQVEDAALLTGAILRDAFAALEEVPREPIGRIARTCSGTTPSRSRPDYWAPAVYPWIKTGEVANAPIRTSEEAISARALHECSLSLLPPGTVLVAMYGQGKTRGQSAVLEVAATTNQACFAILPGERLIPQYLQFWLRHSYQALRSLSEGRGGNQANLNGEMLNAFEVPLPALDEQRRIAAHLSAAIAAAEDACAQIAAHQKAIELLPARLLAQAFQQEEPELCC